MWQAWPRRIFASAADDRASAGQGSSPEVGFLYVTGHGVGPGVLVERLKERFTREYFAQPLADQDAPLIGQFQATTAGTTVVPEGEEQEQFLLAKPDAKESFDVGL